MLKMVFAKRADRLTYSILILFLGVSLCAGGSIDKNIIGIWEVERITKDGVTLENFGVKAWYIFREKGMAVEILEDEGKRETNEFRWYLDGIAVKVKGETQIKSSGPVYVRPGESDNKITMYFETEKISMYLVRIKNVPPLDNGESKDKE